jgi:hypothetical protein
MRAGNLLALFFYTMFLANQTDRFFILYEAYQNLSWVVIPAKSMSLPLPTDFR